ncbi:MAG: hypothetical protein EOO24_32795 [Comamonadaceae bacterium]|nr:MAG: hypothetical protein EOO24_32795 [Comamonadaceae bacterium]
MPEPPAQRFPKEATAQCVGATFFLTWNHGHMEVKKSTRLWMLGQGHVEGVTQGMQDEEPIGWHLTTNAEKY